METEFSAEQYHSSYPDGGELHWWPLARNRIVRHVISRDLPDTASILEIGCGRGIVVKSLREAGFDCAGVEPADVIPMPGVENFVSGGVYAEDLPEPVRRGFTSVLLLDVIEHLPDTRSFLDLIRNAFPNVRSAVITVPARQELWSNYDEYFGHYRRYSRESLLQETADAGWQLQRISYFFHTLYLPAWLLTRLSGTRATQVTPPQGIAKLAHRLVAGGMLMDFHMLPSRLPGSSLIASFRIEPHKQ